MKRNTVFIVVGVLVASGIIYYIYTQNKKKPTLDANGKPVESSLINLPKECEPNLPQSLSTNEICVKPSGKTFEQRCEESGGYTYYALGEKFCVKNQK